MEWAVLAEAAGEAVSQVLVVVACGVILSRTGYLSQSAQKSISKVNLYFMTPCLLFTKIASTINWTQFKAFWPIPVFYVLFSGVSWLVAKVGSRLLGFSKDEEKFVIASVLFSNTNSLPMALLQSLAFSAAGDRLLRDDNDTKEDVAARGLSYILFYAIFGNLVRWSYGFSLLVPKDKEEEDEDEQQEGQSHMPAPSVLINVDMPPSRRSDSSALTLHPPYPSSSAAAYNDEDEDPSSVTPTLKNPKSMPNNKNKNNHNNPSSFLHPHSMIGGGSKSTMRSPAVSIKSATESVLMRTASTAYERLKKVLTPPLLTALIALVIGLVPALHKLFMSPKSVVYRFLVRPIEGCGGAAIPMILLCLGAQVVHFAKSSKNDKKTKSAAAVIAAVNSKWSPRGKSTLRGATSGSPSGSQSGAGLGIYTPNDSNNYSSRGSQDGMLSYGDEERQPGRLSVNTSYNNNNNSNNHTTNRASYGDGIATARSNASSSATLLHFNQSSDSTTPYESDNEDDYDQDDHFDPTHRNGESRPLLNNNHNSSPTSDPSSPVSSVSSSIHPRATNPNYRIRWFTPVPFILVARIILVPVICMPAIIFHPDSLSPILTMDPTFSLTLVLLVAAPTAINMIQLCQIKGYFEQEMAAVLFWSYCVLGIPCVLGWSLVGLWVAGRE